MFSIKARRAAVHEAGHYVAAIHESLTVTGVRIRDPYEVTTVETLADQGATGVLVASAGVVAERVLHDPETRHELNRVDNSTRFKAWSAWSGHPASRPIQFDVYDQAFEAAHKLIDSHRELVLAIAAILERAITNGREFVEHCAVVEELGPTDLAQCEACKARLAIGLSLDEEPEVVPEPEE